MKHPMALPVKPDRSQAQTDQKTQIQPDPRINPKMG